MTTKARTPPPNRGRSTRRDLLVVVALFGASRVGAALLGVRFDLRPLRFFWQIVDPVLLRTELLESVLHLHAQPPLFNLWLGVMLKLPASIAQIAMQLTFLGCGLVLAAALLELQRRLGVHRGIRVVTTVLVVASPAAVLYENHLFYTYPTATLLVVGALLLHRVASDGRWRDGVLLFLTLAAVVLVRSRFHAGWLVAAAAIVGARPQRRRLVAVCLLPAFLLVGIWYARSFVMFGQATTGSWLGMSLAQMTTRLVSEEDRLALATLSDETAILAVRPFSPLQVYRGIVEVPPPAGVAVLDRPRKTNGATNFHHRAYVPISVAYLAAFRAVVSERPELYGRAIGYASALFFRSGADHDWFGDNRARLDPVETVWRRVVYLQLDRVSGRLSARHVGWGLVALWMVSLVGGGLALRRAVVERRTADAQTLAFALLTVVWVTFFGIVLELGENNRFRFLAEPLAVTLAAVALARRPDEGEAEPGVSVPHASSEA